MTDERRDGGKWKKGQCSVRPETSIDEILSLYGESFVTVVDESQLLRKSQVEGPPYEPLVILFFLRLSGFSVSVKSSLGLGGIMMLTSARNKQKVFRLLQLQHCLHGSAGKLLMTNELSFYSDAKGRVQKIWKFLMAICMQKFHCVGPISL